MQVLGLNILVIMRHMTWLHADPGSNAQVPEGRLLLQMCDSGGQATSVALRLVAVEMSTDAWRAVAGVAVLSTSSTLLHVCFRSTDGEHQEWTDVAEHLGLGSSDTVHVTSTDGRVLHIWGPADRPAGRLLAPPLPSAHQPPQPQQHLSAASDGPAGSAGAGPAHPPDGDADADAVGGAGVAAAPLSGTSMYLRHKSTDSLTVPLRLLRTCFGGDPAFPELVQLRVPGQEPIGLMTASGDRRCGRLPSGKFGQLRAALQRQAGRPLRHGDILYFARERRRGGNVLLVRLAADEEVTPDVEREADEHADMQWSRWTSATGTPRGAGGHHGRQKRGRSPAGAGGSGGRRVAPRLRGDGADGGGAGGQPGTAGGSPGPATPAPANETRQPPRQQADVPGAQRTAMLGGNGNRPQHAPQPPRQRQALAAGEMPPET